MWWLGEGVLRVECRSGDPGGFPAWRRTHGAWVNNLEEDMAPSWFARMAVSVNRGARSCLRLAF